jgi:hypothetical protein
MDSACPTDGLTLIEGVIRQEQQEELVTLVEKLLERGRTQQLKHRLTYQAPPEEWVQTGQSRETIQFGVHVKCNKVWLGHPLRWLPTSCVAAARTRKAHLNPVHIGE